MTSKTRIKKTYSNLPTLFSNDGIENVEELFDYLFFLKKGDVKEIQLTLLKNGAPVSLQSHEYEFHFSGIKHIQVNDEEFLSKFGINSENQQEIYEVLKSKLEASEVK
jgi:hypothetical protein